MKSILYFVIFASLFVLMMHNSPVINMLGSFILFGLGGLFLIHMKEEENKGDKKE